MTCTYCGIANHSGHARCAGCGAHSTAAPVLPEPTLYEQIGRAVVDREHANALKTLARLGEREEASERERKGARWTKMALGLLLLWFFPGLFFTLLSFGLIFFFWIYLPYRGVKMVVGWMTS